MKNHSFKKMIKNKRIFKTSKMFRKVIAFSLSLGLLSSSIDFFPYSTLPTEVYAQNTDSSTINKEQYVKNGTILHCFSWSFNTIKDNLPAIKEAGFTAIQTSPANAIAGEGKNIPKKLIGNLDNGSDGMWWWHYQPTDWKIGNWQLGTREEFRAMCEAADKLGIQVIVDVVPNHTSGDFSQISPDFVNAVGGWEEMYHNNADINISTNPPIAGPNGGIGHYNTRIEYTSKNLVGLPDINTENPRFQAYFLNYLNDLIACGADGFRYDTGKHIALPGEEMDPKTIYKGQSNNFWPVVTGKEKVVIGNTTTELSTTNLFIYGEILQGDGLPQEHYTNYVYMTANNYGKTLSHQLGINDNNNSTLPTGSLLNWGHPTPDKIVTWVESHDTFFNEGETANLTDEKLRFGWAAIAARAKGTPLFFSRPAGSNRMQNRAGNNILGAKGNDEFMSKEVQEVNLFRQAMVGQGEYLRNINGNSKIYQIDRGTQGTCIINLGDAIDIDTPTTMKDGTYTDHISGGTFQVQNGNIRGRLAAKKVAVIYDSPLNATTATNEEFYFEDQVNITLTASNLTNTTYTVNGETKPFQNGDIVTLSTPESQDTISITLKGKKADGQEVTKDFTFKHLTGYDIYFKKFKDWNGNINCYVYNGSINNGWPGPSMDDLGFGIYGYKIPENISNITGDIHVIFNANGRPQYPAHPDRGLKWERTPMILNRFSNTEWNSVLPIQDLKVTSLQADHPNPVEGERVTFTAKATGGVTPYKYKFTFHTDGQEIVLRDFSNNPSTNSANIPGSGTIKVEVEDANNRTASKYLAYTWTPNPANYTRDYDIYFKKPSNWGDGPIHCYAYQPNPNDPHQPLSKNHAWPGIRMEEHNGIYRYKLPENLANAKIIFNNHESTPPHYQYPNQDQPGLDWTKGVSKLLVGRTWTIVAQDPLENLQLSSNLTSPQIKNTAVAFTASSEKGIGNISYSFFKVNGDVSNTNDEDIVWEQVQNTTANTLTLQPDTEGIITIKVMAEDQAIHAGLRENQKQSTRLVFAWIPDPNISTPSDATPQDNNQNGNTSTPSDATPQAPNPNTPIPPIQQEQEQNQNTPTPPIQQEQNTIPSIPERNSSRKISNTRWISYPITSIPRSVKGFTPHRVLAATTSTNKWLRDKHGWTAIDHNGQSPADAWRQYEWNGSKDWYYFDKNGYMLTGWHWINGKCYYLDIRTGKMLFNTTTPDGYTVNQNGEWVKDGMVQKK